VHAGAGGVKQWCALTGGLFLASRIVLYLGGLRFETRTTADLALLDPAKLQQDPFLAFTSNHVQPPLWNFFVGSILRWSPFQDGGTFQVLFLISGLLTVLTLWSLLAGLGAPKWAATVAATVVGWSPVMIGYERMLTYESLVTLVVTLSAWCLLRYLREPTTLRLALFAAVLVVGVLTRMTLSPIWALGGIALILLARRGSPHGRSRLTIICIAAALIFLPLAHRKVDYGVFVLSSYGGMNLARASTVQIPASELDALIASGRVSSSARVIPFAPYRAYEKMFHRCTPSTGVPVLDEFYKSDGTTNLNNICYLPVDHQAISDALTVIRADPSRYAAVVGRSVLLYSSLETPGTVPAGFPGGGSDPTILRWWSDLYRPLLVPIHIGYSWGFGDPQESMQVLTAVYAPALARTNLSLVVAAGLLLGLGLAFRGVARWVKHREETADLVRVYIGFTIAVVTASSVLFDSFENARFRAPLDPLVLGPLFVVVLTGAHRFTSRTLGLWRSDV
jgi:hypothetical protein